MDAVYPWNLESFARCFAPNGSADEGAQHERLPLEVLIHPDVTIELWNRIAINTNAPIAVSRSRQGMVFSNVRFRAADVRALWPETPTPPPVSLDQLPAAWTLLECCAWMMLRDPGVVWEMAPEYTRKNRFFRASVTLPDLATRVTALPGAGISSNIRLAVMWATAKEETPESCVWEHGPPDDFLLIALRAGHVTATGVASDGQRREMRPDDWRGLRFVEESGKLVVIRDGGMGGQWGDVLIPKALMVAYWPPRGDASLVKVETADATFEAMLAFAKKTKDATGRPASREDAAAHASRAVGTAYRAALKLYKNLPADLRNPAPLPGVRRK